ncbi:MAG TPA: molybdopterin-dependent oxidoreductase [Anaerolineae bacterium]|nr:molybdopterin-dependent oxidoreductase [Anaerolineae bacterium]MCB9107866.1 molybdopterin-dependent oxidoreductase [Anaerolineales bacterium]HRV91449.1 molybdopterin-dependent oxidoreductase [Anaerolineae bacterium]
MGKAIGQAIKRKEDPRLITGQAKYLDDIQLPGMVHAAVLRSPYAHAKINSIDTSEAESLPGVVGVFTGKDFADLNPLPCAWQAGGVNNNANTPRTLEIDKVTFTGAGVAVVVAESRYIAEDALALIHVDYEVLPVVVDAKKATEPGAPQLHENAPNNICMEWSCGDEAATDQALADADVVIKQSLRNQRLIPTPMEPRGAIGVFSPVAEDYTVYMTSQAPHVMRLLMTAFVFGIPENKLRCISPQVGGGFGAKIFLYPEYCMVAAVSKKLGGLPVKWMETRRENYIATTHGRDHVTEFEVAAKNDGTITGLKVETYANLGGTLSTIAGGIPTTLYGRLLSGVYKFPNIYCKVYGTYTNTGMVDAYRGAGRPEASYLVERAIDLVAQKLNMDPAEVRRVNYIPPEAFPYAPASNILNGLKYDSGEYEGALNKALELVDYKNLRQEQAAAREAGRLMGIGFSSYVEICGVAPSAWIGLNGEGWGAGLWESANVRVHLTGQVVVTTGSQSHGQGHETTMAQIAADLLGMDVADVRVEHSDTLGTPFGYGTYGSRSAAVGGVAIHNSVQKIIEKAKKIGAHMLEAAPEDVTFEDGKVFVKGSPDKAKTIQEVALAAAVAYDLPEGTEPFLDDTTYYDPPNCTYPFGTHVCIVEVDKDTGHVAIKRYLAVDDVGKKINPLIVDGQIHGGVVQGLAQGLWEGAVYDDNGQLVSGSLMDYALPKAHFLPMIETDSTETPSPVNPLGIKGAGEAGTIASAQAVVNAVVDALAPYGITHLDMPLTSQKVWEAIHSSGNGRE